MADVVDIAWDASGRFTRMLSVAPGKFAEVCGTLPAGTKVRWDFKSQTATAFNVHDHAGKDVVFPSTLTAIATAKDTLVTKIEQDYRWIWSNKSAAPVTFTVRLQR